MSERRVYRLTTGALSSRLPPLLPALDRPSLGLMMPQTTAASLVSACRQRAYPNSADTLPTCEDQEDHVAMSTTAARRAQEVLTLARQVVAIELYAAMRGVAWRLREGGRLGQGTAPVYDALKDACTGTPADVVARLTERMEKGALREALQGVCALEEVPHV